MGSGIQEEGQWVELRPLLASTRSSSLSSVFSVRFCIRSCLGEKRGSSLLNTVLHGDILNKKDLLFTSVSQVLSAVPGTQ